MKKIFIILVLAAFVLPGIAVAQQAAAPAKSVSFYMSARMTATYGWKDAEANRSIPGFKTAWGANNQFSDSDLNFRIGQALSAFGASFSQGPLAANVEIRPWNGSYFRHWYGSYKMDWGGQLILGQTWTPTFAMCCEATEDGVGKAGDVQGSLRSPQIGLKIGGFYFAATINQAAFVALPAATSDLDIKLPRLEASYDGVFGPFGLKVFGGYQTWDEVNTATDQGVGIDTWIAGMRGRLNMGPFQITALVHTGDNYNQFGPGGLGADYGGMFGPRYIAANNDVINARFLGGHLAANYKITPSLSVAAGVGKVKVTRDNPGFEEDKDTYIAYYLNFPIEITKGVNMTPEIGYQDGKEVRINGVSYDEGTFKYINVWMKIAI